MGCAGQGRSATKRGTHAGIVVLLAGACAVIPSPAISAEVTSVVTVHALVSSRTSLKVSSEQLRFDVVDPTQPAVVSVDFSAAVRTQAGADVMLSVELADVDRAGLVTFRGDGEGTRAGTARAHAASVAARWIGSGRRAGRLTFALSGRGRGSYTIPVRFVLAAP